MGRTVGDAGPYEGTGFWIDFLYFHYKKYKKPLHFRKTNDIIPTISIDIFGREGLAPLFLDERGDFL